MKKEGLLPTEVTFNEPISATITKGSALGCPEIRGIVAEMQEAGAKPNRVTCSLPLKRLNANSDMRCITRSMERVDTSDESMDEVLMSSIVEACVRIGKPELLSARLGMFKESFGIVVNGSQTFGRLIKAYGYAQDVKGAWRCWQEMRSRHIRPTSITVGCMVEAVVNSGNAEGGYELIHQMQDDDQCREVLSSVMYCSVLKGFARDKKLERASAVYEA
jgi:pentatricopeptide repeat domain-containing protein 1